MSDKRIPKKFKTSWGAEYTVYVTDTSGATDDNEPPPPEEVEVSEINHIKTKNILLLIIAIVTIALCINFKSERSISLEDRTPSYEQFYDAYENSSFNPKNGYIEN